MAFRQSQGSKAVTDHSQSTLSPPEQTHKPSRDKVDPEECHSSNTESQSSTPIPASFGPTNGSVSGEDFNHGGSPVHHDSMEEDSMSEYDNVRSEEEEEQDYEEDEELHTDADGMTYYVHCCPEDESYLEGMDCHEGAEGTERPTTSRKADAGSNLGDAWEFSEGFYEVHQKGTKELIHKCPKPITESTFIQAPMAEDEEDDEIDAEEAEDNDDDNDDPVEENQTYFANEQGKAGESQDAIICKRQCDLREDNKNSHQGPNYSKRMNRGEEVLGKEYKVDKSSPKKYKGDAKRSFIGYGEGNNKSNADNCEVGRTDKNSKSASIFRGYPICKEDRGSRNCILNSMTKPEDTEIREDFKKRHSYRDRGRENVRSDCPKENIGRGQGCPNSYKAKPWKNKEQSVDTNKEMDQVVNEVKIKMKVGPQSTGTDKSIAEKSCDQRRIPGSSQVSVLKPHKDDNTPRAPNTPMQPLESQLQKELARPSKEDCLRSNQGQVRVQFS